MTEIEVGSCTW